VWVYEVWYNMPGYVIAAVVLTLGVVGIAGLILRRWWHGMVFTALITIALPLLRGLPVTELSVIWWQLRDLFIVLAVSFSAVYGFRRFVGWGVQTPQRAAVLFAVIAAVPIIVVSLATWAPSVTPSLVVEAVQAGRDAIAPACSASNTRSVAVPPLPTFDDAPMSDQPLPPVTAAAFANTPSVYQGKALDHFIGPYKSLRLPAMRDFKWPDYGLEDGPNITVPIVVGELGEVLAAGPLSEADAAHTEALRIARRWTFRPFRIGGKPSRVHTEFDLPVGPPDTRQRRHTAFPQIRDWDSVSIRLTGPDNTWGDQAYDLEIRGDGAVTYFGYRHVVVLGRHCAMIARDDVRKLVEAFKRAEFFSLDDGLPGDERFDSSISIYFDGHSKSVTYNNGAILLRGEPDAVLGLPILVRQTAHVQRWTSGNELTVPSLIAENWDFSRSDYANRTMVCNAAMRYGADAETVRALLTTGAPVSTERTTFSEEPLEAALFAENAELARVLLSANVRWTPDQLSQALVLAAGLGDVPLVDVLVKRGAQVDWRRGGKTALMTAAEVGAARVVEHLLRSGASTAPVDSDGRTALHLAVAGRIPDRSVGPDGRATESWDGKSKLRIPAGEDVRRVVELLLDAKADLNARDKNGATPLFGAWTYGEDVAPALIARGADVNARNGRQETPLMLCRSPKVTLTLLEAGADPYARDREQKTALDHARSRDGGADVAAVLERWMARHPARRR